MATSSRAEVHRWAMPVPSPLLRYRSPRPAQELRAELARLDGYRAGYLAEWRGNLSGWRPEMLARIDGYRHALLWLLGELGAAPITGRVMRGDDPVAFHSEVLAGWDVYENPSWTPAGMTWVEATSVHYALVWARDTAGGDESWDPPADTIAP